MKIVSKAGLAILVFSACALFGLNSMALDKDGFPETEAEAVQIVKDDILQYSGIGDPNVTCSEQTVPSTGKQVYFCIATHSMIGDNQVEFVVMKAQ